MNLWLREHAGQSERRDAARTYVAVRDGDVIVGYFSLVVGQLTADESGIESLDSRYPIPCVRLARPAVDLRFQRTGVGSQLLAEAVRLASEVLERAAVQVLGVDALNVDVVAFYARWGFRRFREDPLRLYPTSQQIRASMRAAGECFDNVRLWYVQSREGEVIVNTPEDPSVKNERLNLRLTSESSRLIRAAAVLSGQDVTSFVVNAALERARAVIVEDSVVRLSALDGRDLAAAIERDAVPVPQLVELLRRAGKPHSSAVSDSLSDLVT